MEICTVEGCEKPMRVKASGLCDRHWRRLRRTGETGPAGRLNKSGNVAGQGCSVEGCDATKTFGHGYCIKHYKRWRTHGDPLITKYPGRGNVGCKVDGCEADHGTHGYCYRHWLLVSRYGRTEVWEIPRDGECLAESGCTQPRFRRGLCETHYRASTGVPRFLALEVAGIFNISAKDQRRLDRDQCAACGAADTQTDHIIPVARGGRHSIGNLRAMCRECNSSKGTRTWMEWRVSGAARAAAVRGHQNVAPFP